jgi:hypothetical protein
MASGSCRSPSGTDDLTRGWLLAPVVTTAIVVVAGVAVMSAGTAGEFRPYFGALPPALAAAIIVSAGIPVLMLLEARWGFEIYASNAGPRRWVVAAALSIPFMMAVTWADLALGFPADINVPLPTAILFYPIMGFLAQLALHVIPLAVLLFVGGRVLRGIDRRRLILASIAVVPLVEAAFQLSGSLRAGSSMTLSFFVTVHLFLFGLVELTLFRRYDYASMYVFRLSYYSYWHVAWGWLRLQG